MKSNLSPAAFYFHRYHERRLQIAVIEKTISTLEDHLRQLESEVAETNTKFKTAMNELYKLRLQRPK